MKSHPKLAELERSMIAELYGATDTDIFATAYNIRLNGEALARSSAPGIQITAQPGDTGINVYVKPSLRKGMIHVPTLISQAGLQDAVRNDFFVGAGAEVVIMAGCGIHSDATHLTSHSGTHQFFVGAGARVRYAERHFGTGARAGRRILNPTTIIHLEAGSLLEIETEQTGGIASSKRILSCQVGADAKLMLVEKVTTSGREKVTTKSTVNLDGENSGASLASRSVAKDSSVQKFHTTINGNAACTGHSQCDAIIMDVARVSAVPKVAANHVGAQLIHEAAIGKIAGEQIVKLMTLGLSRTESEQTIIDGFLR